MKIEHTAWLDTDQMVVQAVEYEQSRDANPKARIGARGELVAEFTKHAATYVCTLVRELERAMKDVVALQVRAWAAEAEVIRLRGQASEAVSAATSEPTTSESSALRASQGRRYWWLEAARDGRLLESDLAAYCASGMKSLESALGCLDPFPRRHCVGELRSMLSRALTADARTNDR